jgi:glycine/D-amino acid oxidase-like deaminating enzyme
MEPVDRREFLKSAGAQAGLALASTAGLGTSVRTAHAGVPAVAKDTPDIAVIGAGIIGSFTAYHLRSLGAKVQLIDAYGPGNSRSTSGDETRGVRSSYGDRPNGEQWMRWARQSMIAWRQWDERWWREMGTRVYFPTGDLITRAAWDPFLKQTLEWWRKNAVPHETLTVDEARYRWPVFDLTGINALIYEPDAGVVRARAATQCVASTFVRSGGTLTIDRATTLLRGAGKLDEVRLASGAAVRAGTYVFACGPWLWKVFSNLLLPRMRTSIGQVCYVGTPVGDTRFEVPNMPSHNFPGITGWPAVPFDNRGFRTRTGGGLHSDPDTSDRVVAANTLTRLRTFLAERFPLLKDMPVLETRACHYEGTVSRNFIIDRHPDFSNVWIAGGGNAEAFKQGPVFGAYVADRVLGRPTDPQLAEAFKVPTTTFEEEARKAEEEARRARAEGRSERERLEEENFQV